MNSNKSKEFQEMILVSERDVESKVLIKRFFSLLGYDDRDRAENYAVEWWAGREKQREKYADQIYFNGSEWNKDTSLVVAEAKKPSEKVDAVGQAQFYSMWLRTPYYVLCNGEELVIVLSDRYKADKELLRCSVEAIPQHWAKIESILQKDEVTDYCNRNNLKSIKVGEVDLTAYLTILSSQKSSFDFLSLFAKPQTQSDKIPLELKPNQQAPETDTNTKYKYPIVELAKQYNHLVIIGEPGAGKTSSLQEIAKTQALLALKEEETQIPVLISLHLLNYDNPTIISLIESELKPFVTHISDSITEHMLKEGKFLLLLDGLNEVIHEKRNRVIQQIKSFIRQYQTNNTIITCRKDNYNNQFGNSSLTFEFCGFDEKDLQSVLEPQFYYELPKDIRKLIENPLIFSIVRKILLNQRRQLPSNKAQIYKTFAQYLLEHWDEQKGIDVGCQVDIDFKRYVLSEIAIETFPTYVAFDTQIVRNLIKKQKSSYDENLAFDELINSGIIKWSRGQITFWHPSFQEYFAAEWLVHKCQERSVHDVFTSIISNPDWNQVVVFSAGLFTNYEYQSEFLNMLLNNDLELYVKSVSAKSDLSEIFKRKYGVSLSHQYFERLLSNYKSLIEIHFPSLKNKLDPIGPSQIYRYWRNQGIENLKTGVVGYLNIDNERLFYAFKVVKDNSESQLIEISQPPIDTSKRNDISCDTSLRLPSIDSARLIALNHVKSELKKAIEKHKLIEDGVVLLERVVNIIPKMSQEWGRVHPIFNELTMGKSNDELIRVLEEAEKKYKETWFHITGQTGSISAQELKDMVLTLKKRGLTIDGPLFPERDMLGKSPTSWVVDSYSDDVLKEYVKTLFRLFMIGYKEMVENNFPTIKHKFRLYGHYPIKCVCKVNRPYKPRNTPGGISYIFVPVTEEEANKVELYFNEDYNLKKEFDSIPDKLMVFGRGNQYTISHRHNSEIHYVLFPYQSNCIVAFHVYKQICAELENLLGI